jgi:hypothetical protein
MECIDIRTGAAGSITEKSPEDGLVRPKHAAINFNIFK